MSQTQTAPPAFNVHVVPVTPFQQNCSIIRAPSGAAVVVDPGGEPEKILAAAKEINAEIKEIWLTHGHLDHAGGAEAIKRETGAPIIGPHEEDAFWLAQIEDQWAQVGHPGMGENCKPDRWLDDGDTLELEGMNFDIVHTPGHTPGHVVIVQENARLAFVGDVLFAGSIGRTDFPRSDHQALIHSITNKLWPLGEDMQFVPGHGPASTFGRERQGNAFVSDSLTGYAGAKKEAANETDQRTAKRYR
ncbi:MAG: MBL fold metallo-hydrolase [Pseudomonadota bacterium]